MVSFPGYFFIFNQAYVTSRWTQNHLLDFWCTRTCNPEPQWGHQRGHLHPGALKRISYALGGSHRDTLDPTRVFSCALGTIFCILLSRYTSVPCWADTLGFHRGVQRRIVCPPRDIAKGPYRVFLANWGGGGIIGHFMVAFIRISRAPTLVKWTISSRSENTLKRAWNRCPKLLAHLCSSNGNMTLTCGVLFSVTLLI